MIENYITLSLETHLFFSRIMKEHSLFLEAGFPCKNNNWIQRADFFRQKFEELLADVINISNGRINSPILNSEELATEFTIGAENMTERLSGVPINSRLTQATLALRANPPADNNKEIFRFVQQLNERSLRLLNGLIRFKEDILRSVSAQRLFTANYPLLIEHILREARFYRNTITNIMRNRQISYQGLGGTEEFWNQIMMEHALFIRGLLDPSEEELIRSANDFAVDYERLLETAKRQDSLVTPRLSEASLEETLKYKEFKEAGAKGILSGDIASIILPLLADHVLREANHYIRILEHSKGCEVR